MFKFVCNLDRSFFHCGRPCGQKADDDHAVGISQALPPQSGFYFSPYLLSCCAFSPPSPPSSYHTSLEKLIRKSWVRGIPGPSAAAARLSATISYPVAFTSLVGIGATVLTVPVLSAVGFSAAGPVAGEGRVLPCVAVPPCPTFSCSLSLFCRMTVASPNARYTRGWDSIRDRERCRR